MGDRGYEGDSGYLAHLGSAAGADRWDGDRRDRDRWDSDRWESDRREPDRRHSDGWNSDGWDSDGWDSDRWDADRWDADRWDSDRWGAESREAGRWGTEPWSAQRAAHPPDARRDEPRRPESATSRASLPHAGPSDPTPPHRSSPTRSPSDASAVNASPLNTAPSSPLSAASAPAGSQPLPNPRPTDPASWAVDGLDTPPAGTPVEGAAAVARRLQARLDRHVWLLERMQAEQLYPEPRELPELQDIAWRMRRDTESLLLLCADEPGTRDSGPRSLAELLAEVASAAGEPGRVDVRPGPAAGVADGAADEFRHVICEVVDHVSAAYPGSRVELVSRLELPADLRDPRRGAVVDVVVAGTARRDADAPGSQTAAVAEQLVRRSRHGIALRHPPGGAPLTAPGLVMSVHCPPAAVTVDGPVPPPVEPDTAGRVNGHGLLGGSSGSSAPGAGRNGSAPEGGVRPSLAFDTSATSPSLPEPPLPEAAHGETSTADSVLGGPAPHSPYPHSSYPHSSAESYSFLDEPLRPHASEGEREDYYYSAPERSLSDEFAPPREPAAPPPAPSSSSSQVDELFGPLVDLPYEPIDDRYATPIFEAIASAWFRESGDSDPGSEHELDWETPHDDEWREAAARVARPEPTPTTASGLPLRRPGSQLVPPPRVTASQPVEPPERVPDRIRERLSTYQRGLREGRHRAVTEGAEHDDW